MMRAALLAAALIAGPVLGGSANAASAPQPASGSAVAPARPDAGLPGFAIVTQDNTALRAAPRDSAATQAVLWQGDALEVRGQRADYLQVYDHQVRLEETDGLSIRVPLQELVDRGLLVLDPARDRLVRADQSQALRLPVGLGQDELNASFSLYLTCPDQPSFPAIGTLVLNDLVLAAEGEDTGVDEHVQGSFTATLTRSLDGPVVGQLRSEFDFLPPRQPLATFK